MHLMRIAHPQHRTRFTPYKAAHSVSTVSTACFRALHGHRATETLEARGRQMVGGKSRCRGSFQSDQAAIGHFGLTLFGGFLSASKGTKSLGISAARHALDPHKAHQAALDAHKAALEAHKAAHEAAAPWRTWGSRFLKLVDPTSCVVFRVFLSLVVCAGVASRSKTEVLPKRIPLPG